MTRFLNYRRHLKYKRSHLKYYVNNEKVKIRNKSRSTARTTLGLIFHAHIAKHIRLIKERKDQTQESFIKKKSNFRSSRLTNVESICLLFLFYFPTDRSTNIAWILSEEHKNVMLMTTLIEIMRRLP